MNLKQLRERYAALMTEITGLLTQATPKPEDRSAVATKQTELIELRERIGQLVEVEKLQAEERSREEAEERARAAGRPALPQPGEANTNAGPDQRAADKAAAEERAAQYHTAHAHYLRTQDDAQLRALNSTNGANGGFTIPVITQPILTQALLAFGGVIPYLDSLVTSSGEQLNYPLNNDTANIGREIGENVATTETDITFGTVPLTTGLFSTDSVLVPRTLMRDSLIDIETIVVTALATRRARMLASKVINGSNSGTFASLLNVPPVGATSAAPSAITLVDLALLYGAVDPGYAVNGKFVMHRSTQIYLATLRNGLGAPIFTQDANGMLTKIFGCDVVIDQTMPGVPASGPAAGAKYILFGDLKSYIFRSVGTMEVMRLGERYAEYNQVGFMGWYSAGGQLLDAGTHPIQALQQHA